MQKVWVKSRIDIFVQISYTFNARIKRLFMDLRNLSGKIAVFLALSALAYFNIVYFSSFFFGLLILFFYLFFASGCGRKVLHKFFNLSDKAIRLRVLSAFFVVCFWGFILGICVLFLKLTPVVIAASLFLIGAAVAVLEQWAIAARNNQTENIDPKTEVLAEGPQAKIIALVYFIFIAIGFYLLYISKTGEAINTPWKTINPAFIYIFFITIFLSGLMLLTNLKAKVIIFLFILQSLLLHSYLPLTHQTFYGADEWRHVAAENRAAQEIVLDIKVYGAENLLQKLNPSLFSYSQFWGLGVAFSRLLNVSLVNINKWMLPIIWSLVFPILLFELGRAFGWHKKHALFFAWLGFLPFAFAGAGSFSLPVNLGFLFWLALLLLLVKRRAAPRYEQVVLLTISALGLVFGYALYLMLFLPTWVVLEKINYLEKVKSAKWRAVFLTLIMIVGIAFIPAIELISGYAKFNGSINWFGQIKQVIGNFSSFYLAFGPRPHDIIGGNILFNQVPAYAFVKNWFTFWLFPIFIFALSFFTFVILGFVKLYNSDKKTFWWFTILFASVLGGYIISLYFLDGEHVFARRLDTVLALFFIFFFMFGFKNYIFTDAKHSSLKTIVILLIFSIAICASYSLGPDTSSVSADEYGAMEYIWSKEKDYNTHCVAAGTYPLLALEALSAKTIVGGGFPINQYFAQPELEKARAQMSRNINYQLLDYVKTATAADHCWFAAPINVFREQNLLNSAAAKVFGEYAVIRYNLR